MKKLILILLFTAPFLYSQTNGDLAFLKFKNEAVQIKPAQSQVSLLNSVKLEKKNPGLAICLSILLPGMGELYAGSYEDGKYLTIADAVLWGTVVGLNSYGSWKRDNYKSFAQTYAGISPDGKDDNFYANLCDYVTVEDYNRYEDLQREYSLVYNTTKYYWNWGTDNHRKEYRDMWRTSEQALNSIRFAVGALILNRIISVVNAVRLVTAHNKKVDQQNTIDISFSPNYLENIPAGLSMNIRASF